ncbi:MAG: M20/M25/M40 family metallo-hydrolase [Acidimicrobiales bacterium]
MSSAPTPAHVATALADLNDTILDWVVTLMRTPSVTGDEGAAQHVVATILAELGLEVDVFVPDESLRSHPTFSDDGLPIDRPVVVATRRGSRPDAKSVIFNGHIDVVPTGAEAMFPHGAWTGAITDGALWGRGSCDMKGGLVAAIAGVAVLNHLGVDVPGDIIIQSVTGEESGGVGTLAAVERGYRADAAIIFEPTNLHVCPVGAGSASFRLHVDGRAAHGARRHQGVSAIEKFFPLQQALIEYEARRHAAFSHPAYRTNDVVAPISVGTISAGDWPSTVPDLLIAQGRAGVLPGELLEEARAEFEAVIADAAAQDEWLHDHPPCAEWFEGSLSRSNAVGCVTARPSWNYSPHHDRRSAARRGCHLRL